MRILAPVLFLLSVPYGILITASALAAMVVLFRAGRRVLRLASRPLPVLLALLRTVADLACMAGGNIAAAVANLVWIRRLHAMDAYDKRDFCGKGIPRRDWAAFLDQLASVLGELRSSEEREP